MKINALELRNFCGIKTVKMELPHILALCGRNGMGKTTILNGIRYALTGKEPEGDIIRKGSENCQVMITLPNTSGGATTFNRVKDRTKPTKNYIDGHSTTQKALNEGISDLIGIPLDKVEILSSADVVAAMKPQEFASLILGYIPEKLSLEKVLSFIPATTPGMIDIIDANLPVEGIDLEMLDDFDGMARATRKDLKQDLQAKKLMYDKHIKESPEYTREEIEGQLRVLNNVENEYKIFLEKQRAYESAVKTRNQMLETLEGLKKEADSITATRPDPAKENSLKDKKRSIEESIVKQEAALSGVNSALASLKGTLESLDKSICPISPLITCKTDKSVAKAEIKETIAATEESVSIIKAGIEDMRKSLLDTNAEIEKFATNSKLYDRKISLSKQIKSMEDAMPAEPIKPVEVERVDVEDKKFQLNQQLKVLNDYEDGLKLKKQIDSLEIEVSDYEAIVKMLAEKGPVRTGVIGTYLGIFEEICNSRSSKIRPEFSFRFASENGVVVYMKNNTTGIELTMSELSGGEKAYMLYILIDMLNQLVGTKILVLDELSVLDAMAFNTLLDLVMAHAGDYDHIILSAVDHKEIKEALTAHEIRVVSSLDDLMV